ncbi:hypothetical protein EX30DRAFT_373082 [Ascodesmis nigricans]|uniref:Uncharacterized protein n=1 Tax=Ascodesmis nigricans TaxID=341454 RepID=A0A4S2MQ70_9PEZI|nr:hypothetical protein EX30DRAFT_373082 [Ascodesmis nigricans]
MLPRLTPPILRLLRPRILLRTNATSAPPPPKPTSQHINIYREFGRPFAKVFFMGMFTYQTLYWAWLAMERDEIKREMNGKIEEMEGEVKRLAGIEEGGKK